MNGSPPRARGTIVLDLDGVLYVDREGVPGAAAALRRLEDDGWALLFATNNSTKTPRDVADHIRDRTGYVASAAQAVTSAGAAAGYVASRHRTATVVGAPSIETMLRDAGVHVVAPADADAVVVGLDLALDYGRVRDAARAIRSGAAFVATNTDATYPTPSGPAPGAGSIVAAVATAAGVDPIDCGKPSTLFTDLVLEKVECTPVWMVGDRPETDIAMAKAAGWRSVLVLTGVTTDTTSIAPCHRPDHIVESIAELPDLLSNRAD